MLSAFTAKDITEPEPIEPDGQNSALAIPATGEQEAKGTNVPSTHAPKQVTATNGNPIVTSPVREPITQKSGADQSPAAQLIEKKDAPAISRITNLPTPSRNLRFNDTLIVLTHPDGTQIKVPPVENLHRHRVPNLTLAQAVLKHYETHLPKPSELPQIRRLFLSTKLANQ